MLFYNHCSTILNYIILKPNQSTIDCLTIDCLTIDFLRIR